MHYYQHHISDFNQATRHLTRVERSLYRDLIELYYDNEKPLTSDFKKLSRRVIASTPEEKEALEYVLEEFFTLTDEGYRQSRCDAEIEKYHNQNSAKSKAGKASAESRRRNQAQKEPTDVEQNSTGVKQVFNKCSTNHKPITNNHKPITNKHNPPNPPDGGDGCAHDQSDHKPPDHKPPKVNHVPFDDFWKIYPLKQGRDRAEKSWIKLKPDKTLYNKIILNIDRRLLLGEWSLDRKNFIPHASTYLNQKRWTDEVIARGDQHAAHQPNNQQYRLSTVERVNQNLQRKSDERRRMLESGELVLNQDGTVVPENDGVVLPQMAQQLWPKSDP
jgi:uncharacterized protein YdaU (DUF1376 family)